MWISVRAVFLAAFLFSFSALASSRQKIIYPIDGPFEFTAGLGEPRKGHRHQGVDLGADSGTPVVAIWDGVVVDTGSGGRAGWSVRIEHPNGIVSFYAHLKSRPRVRVGEEVEQGQVLGGVGETGNATFPHLHFEMRQNGKILNPASYYDGF